MPPSSASASPPVTWAGATSSPASSARRGGLGRGPGGPRRVEPAKCQPMKTFRGKLAVVTGGGTGMGRELTLQLAADGCHVAICDVSAENMAETKQLAEASTGAGVRITTHRCDVSDERQVLAFRDAVVTEHATKHVNLLFNNAGIGGGGGGGRGGRAAWGRTVKRCPDRGFHFTRALMPVLLA